LPGSHGGQVLAGKAADQDVNGAKVVCSDGAHVVELAGVGEAVGEDGAADGVDFGLSGGGETGVFKADVEAADAGEQATDGGLWAMPVLPLQWRAMTCWAALCGSGKSG
jgi:hypothetical protein